MKAVSHNQQLAIGNGQLAMDNGQMPAINRVFLKISTMGLPAGATFQGSLFARLPPASASGFLRQPPLHIARPGIPHLSASTQVTSEHPAIGNLLLPTSHFRLPTSIMPAAQLAIAHNGTHQKSNIKNQTSKIANCLLQIAHCKLPIANCQLPIANCQFKTTILTLISILLLITPALTAQTPTLTDTVTLAQVQRIARDRALQVLSAQTDLRIAEWDEARYQAQVRPRLDLAANLPNYFKSFSETIQPDGTVAFRPLTINNSFAQLQLSQPLTATGGSLFVRTNLQRFDNLDSRATNYNGIPVRIGLVQPIRGFNTWKWQRQILPATTAELRARHAAAIEEAAYTATALFFQLLNADQERRIATTNQAAGERLLAVAQERYALGKINRGDLVQIELDMAAATQNRIRAERAVAQASADICQFLGLDYSAQAGNLVPRPPALPTLRQIDEARALTMAYAQRPEALAAANQALQASRDVERVSRELGPQLQLVASLGLVRSDPEVAQIYRDPQTEQIISLNLQLPILDWGDRKRAIQQARTRQEWTDTNNQYAQQALTNNLRLAVQQWNRLGEEIALAERIAALAEERFRISSESYILGSIPLTELTLAQQNRDQLARAYLSGLQNFWLTYADIQRLTLHDFLNDNN